MENRRQHTIPRFYLKHFFPGFVYRQGLKNPRYQKSAKDIAVRIDYYGKEAADQNILDKINTFIENDAAPVLEKLKSVSISITSDDWASLSYFFANMFMRTPAFQENMTFMFKDMAKELNKMAQEMMAVYNKAKLEGKDLSVFENHFYDDGPQYHLSDLLESCKELETEEGRLNLALDFYRNLNEIAKLAQRMSCFVLTASKGSFFLTTDRPLTLFSLVSGSTVGAGWGNRDVAAFMPLDPKHFIVMNYLKEPRAIYQKVLNSEETSFFNTEMVKYAQREIYCKFQSNIASDWMLGRGIFHRK